MFLCLIPSVVHITRTADIFCLGFFKAALQNQLVYHSFIESQHFRPTELHQVQTFCVFTWPDVGQLDGNVVIQEERSAAVFHRVCVCLVCVRNFVFHGVCVCLCVCDKFCVCMHTLQLVCDSHSEGFAFCIFSWLLFVFGNSFQPCIHILCIHVSYYYNVEDNIYLKRSVISTLIHLTPGVSWGGWSVISLLTCSLEHRMMERRSVRAFLKVIEPPMALRVLKRPSNRFLFVLNTQNKSIKKKKNPPTFQWLHPPHHRIWRVHQCLLPWLLCCPHQSRQLQLSWRAPLSATVLSSCWEITLKKDAVWWNKFHCCRCTLCVCVSVCLCWGGGGVIVISRVPCCICWFNVRSVILASGCLISLMH